ncbi:MAG: dephospho-CoA kinase [Fusobacteriaceae bacterium]|nr:dephospho-CoA kinase [Fusobacteriaceae bacterium]
MILGLTGGIACGKTTISIIFKKLGIKVIDADKVAREVIELPEIVNQIKKNYGDEVFINGKLDRKKLREIIFNDKEKIMKLNSIIHPKVIDIFKEEYNKNKFSDEIIVFDIPLLFEVGLEKYCNKTIVVYVNEEIQIKRVMERDNSSRELAKKIIDAQMDLFEKVKMADYAIENNSSVNELEKKVKNIIESIHIKNV